MDSLLSWYLNNNAKHFGRADVLIRLMGEKKENNHMDIILLNIIVYHNVELYTENA